MTEKGSKRKNSHRTKSTSKRQGGIPRTHKDSAQKIMLTKMGEGDKPLEKFNKNYAAISNPGPQEFPKRKLNVLKIDNCYFLVDDSMLHLEYQNEYSETDVKRWFEYDQQLIEAFDKKVYTCVIYMDSPPIEKRVLSLDRGGTQYKFDAIFLPEWNGQELFHEIQDKLKEKEGKEINKSRRSCTNIHYFHG